MNWVDNLRKYITNFGHTTRGLMIYFSKLAGDSRFEWTSWENILPISQSTRDWYFNFPILDGDSRFEWTSWENISPIFDKQREPWWFNFQN